MTRTGVTPLQASFGPPGDFVALSRRWRADAIDSIFSYVWRGFDNLRKSGFTLKGASQNIERGITQRLAPHIRDAMGEAGGFLPFTLEHHPFEDEGMATANAAPKAPDLGFISRENPRAMLPLEAKQLPTDGTVAEYVKEVSENFLKYRYAPFSSEGGMLGYLRKGVPMSAFKNIGKGLGCELSQHPSFLGRQHACSTHERPPPPVRDYPVRFKCHHLIFLFLE